ncbi:MAG: ABC transporter permease [Candidatus Peribacteraceae bacterium]|nr:ABC transporter permease [Candidatus Peribacteraceae bacterium]MDD5075067.1 ABC transporter permease [Candidatus Peribacteraceae bacterium]
MNVIYVLWLRQLKRYLRSRARLIGSLGQPLLFLFAFGFGFGPMYAKAGGGNYMQFLAPGVICMAILFTAVFMGIEIIWDRQFGFLKETLVAPVSRMNIMLGRTLGGATVATIQGVIVFLIALLAGFRPEYWYSVVFALPVMFLIAVLFTAFGTGVASVMSDFHGFQLVMNFLVMPLFFLSGALFPLNDLSKVINAIVRIDPLTYGVDALRGVFLGTSHLGLGPDILVLSLVTVLFLIIGSHLFSKIEV